VAWEVSLVSNLAKCRGLTLIELLVATTIGLLALTVMVSTFVTGTKTAVRITDSSYFSSEFYDVSRFILDDMRRAGYAIEGARTGLVRWAGATSELSILSSNQCIAYAYEFEDSGTEKVRYSSVYYYAAEQVIRLYTLEKSIPVAVVDVPNVADACVIGSGRTGEAITDNNSMPVKALTFDGTRAPLYEVMIKVRSQLTGQDDAMVFKVHLMN